VRISSLPNAVQENISSRKLTILLGDTGPAGQVVRALLPCSIGVPLLVATVQLVGQWKGYYAAEIGAPLFAMATVAVLAGMICRTGHSLLRSDIQRRTAEADLQRRASHDWLTGLPNRGLFLDRLHRRIEKAKRTPVPGFAVLYIDLDEFKSINDRAGHQIGDCLLVSAAEIISKSIRSCDLAARMGGDEFTVLLEEISTPHDVEVIASRIVNAFSENISIRGRNHQVGTSIGVALYGAHHAAPQDILVDADAALYHAKTQGKGRYAIATSTKDTVWLDC
jgi:diguanylate cyclase (GGDEF)-like protein